MAYRVNAELIREIAAKEPYCDTSARKIAKRTREVDAPGVSKSAVDRALWRGQPIKTEALACLAATYELSLDKCVIEETSTANEDAA